jgi:hypothetical protein
MIVEGKNGSMCLYWKDLLICSFPLGRYDYEHYKKEGDELIIQSMRMKGYNIKRQIFQYMLTCNSIHSKKLKKQKIPSMDMYLFRITLMALIKLKIIDEEDVVFLAPRKKGVKKKSTFKYINYSMVPENELKDLLGH